jgi:hypothetical protein
MHRLRDRLTYANVVASVSLFLALGGSAYAVNAVTSEDIVDETIRSQDIGAGQVSTDEIGQEAVTLDRLRYNSVDGSKVVNGSLSTPDVANGSLYGADIKDDSVTGADVDLGVHTVEKTTGAYDPDVPWVKSLTATCPSGETAIGGGGRIGKYLGVPFAVEKLVHITDSRPMGEGGWSVKAAASDGGGLEDYWTLTAYVRCASL